MGGTLGNQNAVGNKGGGRKSAYQENADAALLREMFLVPLSREEVQAKLKSGKYSLKDLFVSKGYAGNERVLLALFNKNFPDTGLRDLGAGQELDVSDTKNVKNLGDVLSLIDDTIKRVRAGTIGLDQANSIGRLASTAIKAIEVGELKDKLDLLNSVIQERKGRMIK